jgi:hypothetical protein
LSVGEGIPARTREGVPGQGFRDGIACHKKGETKKSYRSLDAVPERNQGRTGVKAMYKGTLIDDLTKTVERAEAHLHETNQEAELERWYAAHHQRALVEAELLGVA